MRKMKLFPFADPRTGNYSRYSAVETKIAVFLDNNGYLVDAKHFPEDNAGSGGFIVIYDEYEDC